MISFWFKRTKIVVDSFTHLPPVHKLYPIDNGTNKFPSWFKKMPATYMKITEHGILHKQATIKTCSGILDLYKNSFSMPLWSDLIINTKQDGNWAYQYASSQSPDITDHDIRQLPEINSYIHLKLSSPWLITEKTGVNFYFTDSFYNKMDRWNDYKNVPAIVNYKYQHTSNINMFVPKVASTISIDAGTPIATLIPLTERDVVIKSHLISVEEWNRLKDSATHRQSFTNSYEKAKNIVNNKSKCPMAFFK